MMEKIFKKNEGRKPNFFQRLFKKRPKQNFIIEIENLLCDYEEDISKISADMIYNIESFYKIGETDFQDERERLYDVFLNKCLYDEYLSDTEKKNLNHLKSILHISDDYAKIRMETEAEKIYKNKVEAAISDSKLEESEMEELENIRDNLGVSERAGVNIYKATAKEKIQNFVDDILQKRRLSPEDEIKLNELQNNLNVKVEFMGDGIQKLKLFWQIENGEIPPIPCDINIQKSETLYYKTHITWYEERTRTTHVDYTGISTRFRICKGVYLRAGNIAPSRHTEEYMKEIDSGTVYFTNKRIIFMGSHGNKNIPLTKVLAYTAYNNGIQIEKDTGKSPFFETDDSELIGMYLSRLLAEV